MDYFIEKLGARGEIVPIPLETWVAFVKASPELQLTGGDEARRNPFTGEPIAIVNLGGDAELRGVERGPDDRIFSWTPKGRISFRSRTGGSDRPDVAWSVAARFSREVGAEIVEDDGGDDEDVAPILPR